MTSRKTLQNNFYHKCIHHLHIFHEGHIIYCKLRHTFLRKIPSFQKYIYIKTFTGLLISAYTMTKTIFSTIGILTVFTIISMITFTFQIFITNSMLITYKFLTIITITRTSFLRNTILTIFSYITFITFTSLFIFLMRIFLTCK
jgi:hypothetical protein